MSYRYFGSLAAPFGEFRRSCARSWARKATSMAVVMRFARVCGRAASSIHRMMWFCFPTGSPEKDSCKSASLRAGPGPRAVEVWAASPARIAQHAPDRRARFPTRGECVRSTEASVFRHPWEPGLPGSLRQHPVWPRSARGLGGLWPSLHAPESQARTQKRPCRASSEEQRR
jgi:hypothetical protein